ncbi:exodeoxyribonuclease V subunit beta [Methylococcus sp. EFPC2]|uniref:exodeoxyribonuclease V subunit beta n=1 Tax=Methylococcus sp. EFPC2 TaxID=2812648 RepID=UPI001967C6DC|nr:exodeoxyribonuclease V subunit beta [Methylococcus sp. EFPC2]QSA97707.1 exodeoxyribonuclease V subunit beta [Methylococcus sp. EFPC2]
MQTLDIKTLPLSGISLIEASAGTGKTYAIARLYLRLLLERGLDVRELLVVTFTRAAAGELRGRIREVLRETLHRSESGAEIPAGDTISELLARCENPALVRARLKAALLGMDEAAVYTIHGFCQRVLQESAVESGAPFDPTFLESEAELLPAVVEDFWRRTFYPAQAAGLARLVSTAYSGPASLHTAIRPHLARPCEILPAIPSETVSPEAYQLARAHLLRIWSDQAAAIKTLLNEDKALGRAEKSYRLDRLEAAYAAMDAYAGAEPCDYARPETHFELFFPATLEGAVSDAKRKKGAVAPRHPFFDACRDLNELCEHRLQRLLSDAIDECRADLQSRKQAQNALAFDDLIAGLLDALQGDGGDVMAETLRRRYPVALIDEFQDTDPAQYAVFNRIYSDAPDCGLYMIGDPKQAIYGFRGGDIYTYMQARRDTGPGGSHYTLDTNWRSSTRLVEAVNQVFAGAAAPFLFPGEIDFHPVKASGRADREPYTQDGQSPAPLCLWYLHKTEDNATRGKLENPVSKDKARTAIAQAVAGEIVELLTGATRIGDRPLRAGDIAILVRNRYEAADLRQALTQRGTASVFLSQESVFATEEARELQTLLAAVAEPLDAGLMRLALAGALIGMDAQDLQRLAREESEWEKRREDFQRYHRLWLRQGYMAMFQEWLADYAVPSRLLAGTAGERRLTDLLHLSELLQAESGRGMEGLLRWLADRRREPDGAAEGQQLRLESDENLVKVVTVHKSKGLEYPVVFLPGLWDGRPHAGKPPFVFHREDTRALCLELGSDALDAHHALADRERLAEELRLLYVALTRARHRCYLVFGDIGDARTGALAYLLYQTPGMEQPVREAPAHFAALDEPARRARLEKLALDSAGAIALADLPTDAHARTEKRATASQSLKARPFTGRIDTDWRIASYSALTARGRSEADYDAEPAEWVEVESRPDRWGFPRGERAGRMLHELLERLDFTQTGSDAHSEEASRVLRKYAYDEALWLLPLVRWMDEVLDTPLPCGLRLRDLPNDRRLNELEFHYPLAAKLRPETLQGILHGLGDYRPDSPTLRFEPTRGVMHGYIDLVFEHEGRYFLADYKSNHLGSTLDAYRSDPELCETMNAHRYDLQYLLYSVALHRYLGWRLGADYDYERHYGGVYYLFLRGMSPTNTGATGIYATRPPRGLIDALDRSLAGH